MKESSEANFARALVNLPNHLRATCALLPDLAMPLPTLQLALRLDCADVFGSLEWVLASARRTGLSLRQLQVDSERGHLVNLCCDAPVADLLHLFVRRVGYGVEVKIVDAEFSDDLDAVPVAADAEAEMAHA